MKKIYIIPVATTHMVHGRTDILDRGNAGYMAQSINAYSTDGETKGRDGGDMNFVSGSDEGASTGGFGSDAGPWESLW